MANNVKVYPIADLKLAIKSGYQVLTIQKKANAKEYGGTKFFDLTFYLSAAAPKVKGWFLIKDVPLTVGVANPKDSEDPRNKFKGTRFNVQTSRDASGVFGEAIDLLQPLWIKAVNDAISSGIIVTEGQKVHDLMQYVTSKKNTTAPNAKIENPPLRMKVDFSLYPGTFSPAFLAGKPRTQLFDYSAQYTDANGKIQYKPAMISDDQGNEVPVDESNMHLFLVKGSIIRTGRISMTSLAVSDGWVSASIHLVTAVVERGTGGGFDDDESACAGSSADLTSHLTISDATNLVAIPPSTNPTIVVEPKGVGLSKDEIEEFLGEI